MSDTEPRTGGRRLVVTLYVGIVLLTAAIGFVIGYIGPQGLDPELYGFIQLPPTPFGMALYGGATIATILGVLLAGVVYVSEKYDDAEPGRSP
ncbi:DUF7520 family protein [Halosegnis marinus]|uniref:Cox cluster protein n=1 Tax=Halosegnis marinus TaxID=3034023 RepID=A0ABD5ZR74_9EURY|nr:cox cluster protein [Halosegnis sp. DT85]